MEINLTVTQQFQLERIKRSVECATPEELRGIIMEMTAQEMRRVNMFKQWMKTGQFVEELTHPSYSLIEKQGDSDATEV